MERWKWDGRQIFYAVEKQESNKTIVEYLFADDDADLPFDTLRRYIEEMHEPLNVKVLFIVKSDKCEIDNPGIFQRDEVYV